MKRLANLLFGTSPMEVTTLVHLPIQTTGAEADARREAMRQAAKACIASMGSNYRLYGQIELGSHRYVMPRKLSRSGNIHRLRIEQAKFGNLP